jgi:hypothetical protein
MSIIRKGYRITVTSWENDADNYNTLSRDGLDQKEVECYVEMLKLLKGSYCNDKKVFGNLYEPRDHEVAEFEAAIRPIMDKHGIKYDDDYPADTFCDLVGEFTGYGEGYMTRVVESLVVEYVPEDIIIEDVSKNFGV